MRRAENIQSQMNLEFKKMDEMYANDEFRVFVGSNTSRLFKEIDIIRRKQIELANDHINLEVLDETSPHVSGDMEEDYKRNMAYFNIKEMALKNLGDKLDTLGQIISDFRDKTESNPHIRDVIQEPAVEPTSLTHPREFFAAINALRDERCSQTSSPSTTEIPTASTSVLKESVPTLSLDQSPSLEES
ncbi:hypothetical protein BD408DRAFT_410194 [Parasitella parasitica]|nr:hypothetical protein BD408DRAFT_410194 [Parasitella parasitica]